MSSLKLLKTCSSHHKTKGIRPLTIFFDFTNSKNLNSCNKTNMRCINFEKSKQRRRLLEPIKSQKFQCQTKPLSIHPIFTLLSNFFKIFFCSLKFIRLHLMNDLIVVDTSNGQRLNSQSIFSTFRTWL